MESSSNLAFPELTEEIVGGKKDLIVKLLFSLSTRLLPSENEPGILKHFKLFSSKENAINMRTLYYYFRKLDDYVDEGTDPINAKSLISAEINFLDQLANGKQEISLENYHSEQILLIKLFAEIDSEKANKLIKALINILKGLLIDNELMLNMTSLDNKTLLERHLYHSMGVFDLICINLWEEKLSERKNINLEQLFQAWIIFDAFFDFNDDLAAGLILLSDEDLKKYNINFKQGEVIPNELRTLFYEKKSEIAKLLFKKARHIFETSIPIPPAFLLYCYFISKAHKLNKADYPVTSDTRFAQNIKSLNITSSEPASQ